MSVPDADESVDLDTSVDADHRADLDGTAHTTPPRAADEVAAAADAQTEDVGGAVAPRPAIEAILMVADEPISELTLATVLDQPRPVITDILRTLAASYADEDRGFDLREVAGGWRFYTREHYAEIVERFVLDGQQARLTQAALETLAVVAYKQPVSRTRVSAVRGVNCDGVMRTLVSRGLVEEAGADEESQATLYRTTLYFLERLGIGSLTELPELAPYLPEVEQVEPEQTGAAIDPRTEQAGTEGAATEQAGTEQAATEEAAS